MSEPDSQQSDPFELMMRAMGAQLVSQEAEKRMKNMPRPEDADLECPYCKGNDVTIDRKMKTDYNITLCECIECGEDWCRDQTVKIPGVYVRRIVWAIQQHQNYTGLSDFVRDAIRMKCDDVLHSDIAHEDRGFDKLASLALLALSHFGAEDDGDDDDWTPSPIDMMNS